MRAAPKAAEAVVLRHSPDPELLKTRFRWWHVESLLNQAAELAEKCLEESQEYASLTRAATEMALDLSIESSQIDLESLRPGYPERSMVTTQTRAQYFANASNAVVGARWHSELLYQLGEGAEQGRAGHIKAGQGLNEKQAEEIGFQSDRTLSGYQSTWSEEDRAYIRRGFELRRAAFDERVSHTAPGKAFGLAWQAELVFSRLSRSYADAYNRAFVASEGLRVIYGRQTERLPGEQPALEAISQLANWVRTEIEWLAAYAQLDQAFTCVMSLRGRIGEDAWDEIDEEEDLASVPVHFELPADLFSAHYNVRLRGLSASLVGKNAGVIPWTIVVRLPEAAVFQRSNASTPVNQSSLPNCVIGRVENRLSTRMVELCGLISLMNASPIGDFGEAVDPAARRWTLSLMKPKGAREEKYSSLDDVVIEINAVGQPRGGQRIGPLATKEQSRAKAKRS
jgi:hypothetical protein